MIVLLTLAVWAAVNVAQAAHGADEQADRARAVPVNCPYHFGHEMPPMTFCVYRGVALASADEICATDVVVIWSRFGSQAQVGVAADKASGPTREVYLAFVTDPDLVLRAIVDSWQGDHAEIDSYSMGRHEAPQPLAGEMTLRTVRLGSSGTADVLDVELRAPRRFRPGDCAFASYSGTFIGVIGPRHPTEPVSEASLARQR
jgi:hypothetical protein